MQSRYAIIAAVLAVFLAVQVFDLFGPRAGPGSSLTGDGLNIQKMTIDRPVKDLPLQIVENPT